MEALWIGAAFVLGLVFREIGLPPLIGFLAAGFALNAFGFESNAALAHIAHLGVLLLLFTVGLKVRLRNLVRPEVWGTALVHLLITGGVLALLLHTVLGLPWAAALLIGTALGFSSTVVAAKSLEEKGELSAFHGRVVIGILIVQDVVAVALLGLASGIAPSPWALALVGFLGLKGLLIWLLRRSGHEELLILFGLLVALVAGGFAFEHVGLSSELGALLLGALLADSERASELGKSLWSLKEVFLVAFFLNIGMSGLPSAAGLAIAAGLAVVLLMKSGLFFYLLTRFKLRARSGFLAGLALMSYSEFALIVANVGVNSGVIERPWLAYLAVAIALSFVISAPFNRFSHVLWEDKLRMKLRHYERDERHPDDAPISLGSAHVVVVGMGRVGTGAYEYFKAHDTPVVGLDSDPAKIQKHLAAHRRVVYADAEDPGMWERLNLDGVQAVLLTMADVEAKVHAAATLKRCGFAGLVSATNVYPDEAEAIVAAGCTSCFNLYEDAGVGFAEHALTAMRGTDQAPTGA